MGCTPMLTQTSKREQKRVSASFHSPPSVPSRGRSPLSARQGWRGRPERLFVPRPPAPGGPRQRPPWGCGPGALPGVPRGGASPAGRPGARRGEAPGVWAALGAPPRPLPCFPSPPRPPARPAAGPPPAPRPRRGGERRQGREGGRRSQARRGEASGAAGRRGAWAALPEEPGPLLPHRAPSSLPRPAEEEEVEEEAAAAAAAGPGRSMAQRRPPPAAA